MEMALYRRKPNQNPITSIFKYTVNSAAKTLVSVAHPGITGGLWKAEPLRFMANLLVRSTVWVLQILMDHLPYFMKPSSPYKLLQGSLPLGFLTYDSSSSSSTLSSALGCIPSMDIALPALPDSDEPSVTSLERALSQILTLINKIPATSSKYQSAMSMATKIMEENGKTGNVELLEINRTALASAFARTSQLLHSSLERTRAEEEGEGDSIVSTLAEQLMHLVPMGSYVTTCVKTVRTCANAVASALANSKAKKRKLVLPVVVGKGLVDEGQVEEILAEKLAQELLWITCRLRDYGAIDEAMVQWSLASDLASFSLNAHPRVQGFLLKISGILFEELSGVELKDEREVKFRMLWLWLPLLCHAGNGLAYPVLSSYEKAEIERSMDQVIGSLPAIDQEVILTNWFEDFSVSASEWPNLQISYDRWCQDSRQLVE